ncbi:sigma-70 family RNA polymerase sigma factor [Frigoriglobus tundricola]|uniref:RNA polymerase sigma factor 70 region 4 type 2 domain-containing protein n=1 Tax=Frigoriglobus tundricola TaxID=2774151 RepID=A0A6M5Z341_9BACT|nr:sigma-70 family RNA polymerase sigma factor [Frigoriglobus tundricola]QJW99923.1 hypothetical protein FTUN_7546 [Frigoriglobus tundricola]
MCRRALPAADTEDACQAVFVVLARKAAGRWQPSVANWLYSTARKVCRDARRAAGRRAKREGRAAIPEAVSPADQMTAGELFAALDDELDRLPPIYREPLVLCYLDGLTREDAAVRLGVPSGTVKSRLERGRKSLAGALAKRGLALGLGLLTLAATSPAGASPPQLVESILAAVGGKPSASVAALAQGGVMNRLHTTVKLAAVVLALAGLGFGVLTGPLTARPRKPAEKVTQPQAEVKAEPPKPDAQERTIRGKVVDPNGKPAAGAEVFLFRDEHDRPERLGVTGADGTFAFRTSRDGLGASVGARAEGAGVGFVRLDRPSSIEAVELRLVADEAIRGRVIDTEGKPVAGARVTPLFILWSPGQSADWFLNPWKTRDPRHPFPAPREQLRLPPRGSFLATTTDADGRFVVTGTGAERVVALRVSGTGIAATDLYVITRPQFDPAPYNEAAAKNIRPDERDRVFVPPLHGPSVSLVVEPEKVIRGTVTAAGSDGKPARPRGGATVTLTGPLVGLIRQSARTDAEGRYEIRGARKATGYVLEVAGDPDAGLLPSRLALVDPPGQTPLTANVTLVPGVVITGRVVDKGTGRPVAGWVATAPMVDNQLATNRPEYAAATWDATRSYTKPDGTFRVVAVPGPVLLMGGVDGRKERNLPAGIRYKPAVADPKYARYFNARDGFTEFYNPGSSRSPLQGNYCKVFELKEGAAAVKNDVVLEPADAPRLIAVRDPNGNPVKGVLVSGVGPVSSGAVFVESDTCAAYHLERRVDRLMVFYEPTKKLYGSLTLNGDGKEPVTVTVAPAGSVTGRLVGADGKPIAGAVVRFRLDDRGADEIVGAATGETPAVTGADGSFRLDTLPAGLKFTLLVRLGKREDELGPYPTDPAAGLKPDARLDLGAITPKKNFDGE